MPRRGRVGLVALLLLVGLAAYAVSLAIRLPARFVAARAALPSQIVDVSGTVWEGQAILKDGYETRWTVLPMASLLRLSMVVEWRLNGPDSALHGQAAIWPQSATLTDVKGSAGWGLVKLAVPTLAASCDGSAEVALSRVVIRLDQPGAVGELNSGPTVCVDDTRVPPKPVEVPPLKAVATIDGDASHLVVTNTRSGGGTLADVLIRDRTLFVTIQPEAAKLIGSMPTSGPITLEYPF